VYNAVFWLICFPQNSGIHPILSARTIVPGVKINFNKHCKLQFGTYVQVHEQHNNLLMHRTAGAKSLRPSGNAHGSLNLHSGKHVTPPMSGEVINTKHQLARA